MRKWVDSILKILKRKVELSLVFQGIAPDAPIASHEPATQFNEEAPPVEYHAANADEPEKFDIITVNAKSSKK